MRLPSTEEAHSLMALSDDLLKILHQAIHDYDFPCVTFDFKNQHEIKHDSMKGVEAEIRSQLLVDEPEMVRDGFSNVLYWGYARTGYRSTRVKRFRETATIVQLHRARRTLQQLEGPGVRRIAQLKLPEFSGLSFVSKVRMFLDPANYVVLDRQLLQLRKHKHTNIFHEVAIGSREKRIRINEVNEAVYERWSSSCRQVAAQYFSDRDVRAVDVERGIFYLVQTGRAHYAVEILANA